LRPTITDRCHASATTRAASVTNDATDISRRAEHDPDEMVTVDDLRRYYRVIFIPDSLSSDSTLAQASFLPVGRSVTNALPGVKTRRPHVLRNHDPDCPIGHNRILKSGE
jgi:hypothetical protein